MKDLTHYLVDAVKCSENSVETASEVIEELQTNVNGNTNQRIEKRSRVKIKITKSNSHGKICEIVKSKDDLIDKTPSPSPASSRKTRGSLKSALNETPTNSNSKNKIKYNEEIQMMNLDLSDESIYSPPKRTNSSISPIKRSNNQMVMMKEESNAFQILMTRDKPNKNMFTNHSTSDKSINEIKDNNDIMSKFEKTKEKLAPADNRLYSKRKLNDEEEEIKIEEELNNRTKIFKRNSNDNVQNNSTSLNQRISTPQGFHSYFTKIVSEEKENPQDKSQLTLVDSMNNKINGHKSTENFNKLKHNKHEKKIKNSQSNSNSPIIVNEQESNDPIQNRLRKQRWSLRINLPLSDDDSDSETKKSSINGDDDSNDLLFGKKIKSKEKLKKQNPEKEKKRKVNKKSKVFTRNTSSESDDVKNNTDIEIIESKISKRPPNEKLAPLFVKKPKPDPNVIAARQLFLHSQSPEKERKKLEKINMNPKTLTLSFPTISHVTQIEKTGSSSLADLKYCFKELTSTYNPTFNITDFKSVINLNNSALIKSSQSNKLIKQDCDLEEVLKEIEEQCTDVREMWTKICAMTNKQNNIVSPKRRGRKKKSVDGGVNVVAETNNNENDVWTQKYKPLNTKEIIGNEEAVMKLKNWLNSWSLSANNDDYSSSEEFYNSDNSRSCNAQSSQQVAVLLGPHGSGKTISVYAIAEELGYNVLEVNASSKRPGRKILKDLDEATKSHRVKNSDLKSIFQQTDLNEKKVQKNSLILFEDVDIIFDEDEGFISAAYQLASNTKRPIVMTCRDSCTHLSRMAPQQLKIYFQATQGSRALAFLDLISLAEAGTRLPRSCLDKFLINGDLRKALLQLQYLLASETPSTFLPSNDFRETLWQDMRNYLYKPTVKLHKKRIKKKSKAALKESEISSQDSNNKNIIHDLANDLDTISIISSLVDVNDSILNVSQLKFEPSLSLEENMSYYSINHVRSIEIGEWLRHQTMSKYASDVDDVDHSKVVKQLLLKKELNIGVDTALSQISMHTLDSRIMAVDYLPATRTICRAEELKSTNNTKRGNRFFHYLHNFRLPSGSLKPTILAAACKVMQEKL
ncbi:ATPase family AAA domain-containing protein 5 [Chelonus insularis]|uniref:ATPase family AAA domain-containing protein 5 n=1 Tax=Chelonus insularis TaxID=460826 RepID=UPI00158CA7A4|nr:ATPase family AAA domain-containing protein 5 [Chelonus insularis]